MPAPVQDVHLETGGVGELNEENFVGGKSSRIVAECQGMEAVDDQTEGGMIGLAHDFIGVAPSVDMPSPRQGLVPNPQAAPLRPFGQCMKIRGSTRIVVDRVGVYVAAHQKQIGPERLHHVEFTFGSVEVSAALRLRHRFEVAEGLKTGYRESQARREVSDIFGRTLERE